MAEDGAVGLAEYIRTRRLRSGLTQEGLAERAGLTVDTIGALERGLRRRLYPHTARALADALALSDAERAELTALAHGPSRARGARPPASPRAGAGMTPDPVAAVSAAAMDTAEQADNLPAPLTRLIGREGELAQIQERLAQARLLTLTGAGGIGKTRLAIEAARALRPRYPGGVWLVELAPVSDPALVLGAIAAGLGVRETPGQPPLATLAATVHGRRLLLVLDNCEQVLDAAPDVAALLRACPALAVLATSRAPLRVTGEQELNVPPLAVPSSEFRVPSGARSSPDHGTHDAALPDSVRLFVERATAVRADFALTPENAPAVAQICARLDGLPLAIELAAARAKLFSPQALLARLDHRLPFLTGGARDLPARHQTLRAAIAWSHDLLAPPERALFRRLGVFVGGFTLAEAAAICADAGHAPDLIGALGALVDKSLLRVDEDAAAAHAPGGDGAGVADGEADESEPRLVMLETIREYALELLATEGEAVHWGERHLAHYLALMERAEPDLHETASISTVRRTRRRLAPEQGNLRAALDWAIAHGDAERALRLTASLCAVWAPAGNLLVARRWLDQSAGTLREARGWLEQALAMSGPASDAVRANAFHGLGRVLLFQWDDPNADCEDAILAFERSLALYRRLADRQRIARCLIDLGWALLDRYYISRDASRAATSFDESLALCRALDDAVGVGWSLVGMGRIAHMQGDGEHAADLFEEGLAQHRRAGNHLGMAAALDGLGLLHQSRADHARALTYFEQAVEVRRAIGAQSGLQIALQRLAVLLGARGDLGRAAVLMGESLVLSQRMNNPWDIANSLLIVGSIATGMGDPERGARLFGAGEALIAARGLVVPEAYRGLYGRNVAMVRRTLGDEAFAAAQAAGAALTLDQAIAEALHVAAPHERPTRAD